MTITVTSDTLISGARNLVMQFTGVSDGTGNESNVTKVSVGGRVKIQRLTADVTGGLVTLKWNATVPVTFAQLNGYHEVDYRRMGGLINHSDGDGSITLSTSGFGVGSGYTLTLEMVKKF